MAFSSWKKEDLEEIFGLTRVKTHPVLTDWLNADKVTLTEYEKTTIEILKDRIDDRLDEWNESELIYNFVAPLINLVNFYDKKFRYFSERKLTGKVKTYDLTGDVDGLIAFGREKPKIPYFCLYEYKPESAPSKHPLGQILVAMLLAQEKNKNKLPIYGAYVIGQSWTFIILQGKEYCRSVPFLATRDIYDIFFILHKLKDIIKNYSVKTNTAMV